MICRAPTFSTQHRHQLTSNNKSNWNSLKNCLRTNSQLNARWLGRSLIRLKPDRLTVKYGRNKLFLNSMNGELWIPISFTFRPRANKFYLLLLDLHKQVTCCVIFRRYAIRCQTEEKLSFSSRAVAENLHSTRAKWNVYAFTICVFVILSLASCGATANESKTNTIGSYINHTFIYRERHTLFEHWIAARIFMASNRHFISPTDARTPQRSRKRCDWIDVSSHRWYGFFICIFRRFYRGFVIVIWIEARGMCQVKWMGTLEPFNWKTIVERKVICGKKRMTIRYMFPRKAYERRTDHWLFIVKRLTWAHSSVSIFSSTNISKRRRQFRAEQNIDALAFLATAQCSLHCATKTTSRRVVIWELCCNSSASNLMFIGYQISIFNKSFHLLLNDFFSLIEN